ncbi:DUF4173 domain-containing protein [Deinococcus taeanensis]|nr:DUF4173 domain-containing protein [Deinococcus taeanensis]
MPALLGSHRPTGQTSATYIRQGFTELMAVALRPPYGLHAP